jgi:hypothetical protein
MPALFNLVADYRAAAEKLADMDLDAQTVADTLESMSGELEVKAQNLAMMCLNLESVAEAIKAHEEMQGKRRKAIEARAASLREYLQRCLEGAGIEKVFGPGITISFRSSTAVYINEPGLIPADYMRTPIPPEPSPDKTVIAAALRSGKEVPGAHLEHRKHLSIK